MVEANSNGDGINRRIHYAKFRTDKAPTPGYSAELISDQIDPANYDDLERHPQNEPENDTLLKIFKRNVSQMANRPFLGTRQQLENGADGKPRFGEYVW